MKSKEKSIFAELAESLATLQVEDLEVKQKLLFPKDQYIQQKTAGLIHDFETETREGEPFDLEHVRANFLEGFSRVWREEIENDGFNRLKSL